ncbi:MAG: hypothetical protein JXD18_08405 [Anaerolineae bacterium]|nr:hypothetical protein [Anaerolineae bacterium]
MIIMIASTACGPAAIGAGDGTEESASFSPLPTQGSTSPLPIPPRGGGAGFEWAVEKMEGAVIVYHRSGGFVGSDDTWYVYADGQVVASDGETWRTSPERVAELVGEIERLGFAERPGDHLPINPHDDGFAYELAVCIGDQVYAARAADGTPEMPQAVWDSLQAVAQFIAETQP